MNTQSLKDQKIFIIGLPRTGTTSVCVAMLSLGYSVAHTAYVRKAFEDAQVMADTPIFADYEMLDKTYPNSKFIYLMRKHSAWVPSIKQLLQRMAPNVLREDGGFNPTIKRCFTQVFSPFNLLTINDDVFLKSCYVRHKQLAEEYFRKRENDLLMIDISELESYEKLLSFLSIQKDPTKKRTFEQLNKGSKVTAWNDIKHPLKIPSTKNGRIEAI